MYVCSLVCKQPQRLGSPDRKGPGPALAYETERPATMRVMAEAATILCPRHLNVHRLFILSIFLSIEDRLGASCLFGIWKLEFARRCRPDGQALRLQLHGDLTCLYAVAFSQTHLRDVKGGNDRDTPLGVSRVSRV